MFVLPVLPSIRREKFLFEGADGRIYLARDGYVVKELLSRADPFAARRDYWAHRIAHELFPGNVLRFHAASDSATERSVLISKKIEVDEDHLHTLDAYKKGHGLNCAGCKKAFDPARTALREKTAQAMKNAGLIVDSYPTNFAIVEGKPFFFEVNEIDPDKVRAYVAGNLPESRERVEKMLARYEKLYEQMMKHFLK